ncbi:unnamed protein product [Pseudo-nitzschia multistriata]|uniref:Uncharacterized protein n=1 Tax=Pseudo-nitzschia multistriata TaxID=183589 RepID=A0A448Z239_9STRA|nr:unnamed protein product [Pseudo-nitzschia multistriata]
MSTLGSRCRLVHHNQPDSFDRRDHRSNIFYQQGRCVSGAAATRRKGRGRRRNVIGKGGHDQKKKIFFQSLGCPRNFVDTEVMLGYAVSSSEDRGDGGDMELASDPSEADVVVINTCGFLESARDESMAAIADAQEVILEKNQSNGNRQESKLVVTGCMVNLPAQQEQIRRDFPGVDAVLSSGNIDSIVETIRTLDNENSGSSKKKSKKTKKGTPKKHTNTDPPSLSSRKQRKSFLEKGETPRFLATPPHYAYLKIAEGCRKRCSFCVIPKLKGRLQSKPIPQVVEEFEAIVQHGTAREVILIAQDLGDYGLDFMPKQKGNLKEPNNDIDDGNINVGLSTQTKSTLTLLLEAILSFMDDNGVGNDDNGGGAIDMNGNTFDDPFWLRLLYLYPDEITPDLIDLMEADRRIARYVDLPIQHSHDDMLKAMRRKTDSTHIKNTIATLRERLPDIYIRTSLMVGFPGETDEHFEDLLQFVRDYKLDHVGVFIYSNEEMAYSSRLDGQVPEDVKEDRYRRLMEEQWKIVEERHRERVDRSECLRVVVEGLKEIEETVEESHSPKSMPERSPTSVRIVGRHAGQCPEIDGQVILEGEPRVYPGERYWVEVTGYEGYDLVGRVLLEEDS